MGAEYEDPGDGWEGYVDGKIDEVRLSNVERGGRWLETSYNFQNNPSGSIEIGSEQTSDGGYVNTAPSFSGWQPTSTSLLTPTANVTITDADGNTSDVYWYISTDNSTWGSPSQHNTSVLNESVVYDVSEASSLGTTYYIKIAANDSHDNSTQYWNFNTIENQGTASGFGGKIEVTLSDVNISITPQTLDFGEVSIGSTSNTLGTYFTITNEGSSTVIINITVNTSSNWTYVSYENIGKDAFSMNFTTDEWKSETNIEPANPPSTTLANTLTGSGTIDFGLRIIMPTGVASVSDGESLTVWITAEAA
jgi:hypothetical protein